jgi:hypothetical protein
MTHLAKALVGLSTVAFALAGVTNFTVALGTTTEGRAKASADLTLLVIDLVLCFRTESSSGR